MGKCVIDKERIAAPARCRLILDVDDTRLGVAVVDPLVPSGSLWREIPLSVAPAASPSGLVSSPSELLVKALEEAVYDNPVLLSGFCSVEVVLHTPWFMLMPPDMAGADISARTAVAEASMPEEAREATMLELPADGDENPGFVLFADTRLVDFLRRTFSNPRFRHPLEVMCAYFHGTDPLGVGGKMFARFCPGSLDLMAFGTHGPVFANTFACVAPVDAVYFILAVRASLGMDASAELLLAGDSAARDEVTPLLRRYLGFAMPLPLPSRSGISDDAGMPFHIEALINI